MSFESSVQLSNDMRCAGGDSSACRRSLDSEIGATPQGVGAMRSIFRRCRRSTSRCSENCRQSASRHERSPCPRLSWNQRTTCWTDSPLSPGYTAPRTFPPGEHALDPTVFRWGGLTEKHLDLAEHYIGLPVRYLGVEIKREAPGESSHQAIRRWHIDVEDRRMLKMIIYLSDVDDQSAPFEYVDSASTQRILFSRRDVRRPLPSADTFENIIFEEEIHRVTGPRLTVIYADTSHILHRVKTPTESERTSVTFVYASDTAFYAYPHFMPPPRKALQELRPPTLSSRQLRALGME